MCVLNITKTSYLTVLYYILYILVRSSKCDFQCSIPICSITEWENRSVNQFAIYFSVFSQNCNSQSFEQSHPYLVLTGVVNMAQIQGVWYDLLYTYIREMINVSLYFEIQLQ